MPLKYAEFGVVHRNEPSGTLHGLLRIRAFTQDDAHIFCTSDQIEHEISLLINDIKSIYERFGFNDLKIELSTRPEKRVGSEEIWDKAESSLKKALESNKIDFTVNPGDGAFYGPKIDFSLKDSLGRVWQLGTIQVDYNLPERFELTYKGNDNELHRPVMIHRAPFGSMERFVAILLEHTGGNFPLWLMPKQVNILCVSEKHKNYAEKVFNFLENHEIRALLDDRNETIGKKIRESEMSKTPYMIILGEQEAVNQTVSLRKHQQGDMGSFTLETLAKQIKKEIEDSQATFEV